MVVAQITTDNREAFRTYDEKIPRFGTAPEALISGLARIPDIELHILSCTQQPMVSPEKLGERVWFHSLHVPKLGWLRGGYLGCVLALRDELSRICPDVVHGQGTERECALGAVYSGFPNVITIHGNMVRVARLYGAGIGSYHWLTARLENFALQRTQGVFCNSAYTEDQVRGRASRRWLVPNAVRDLFLKKTSSKTPKLPTLVNVGVVCPLKRQVELLEWALRMKEAGKRFQLRFAGHLGGDQDYNARFSQLLHELQGMAFYDGVMGAEGLCEWLNQGTAMIHVSAEEACSLAIIEGLAQNLSLFAFDVGGNRDLITGMEGGVLVADCDWKGLESAVSEWLAEDALPPQTATLLARERYHSDLIAARHVEIYRELLG